MHTHSPARLFKVDAQHAPIPKTSQPYVPPAVNPHLWSKPDPSLAAILHQMVECSVIACCQMVKIHYTSFSVASPHKSVTSWRGQKSVVSAVSSRFPNSKLETSPQLPPVPRLYREVTGKQLQWILGKKRTKSRIKIQKLTGTQH